MTLLVRQGVLAAATGCCCTLRTVLMTVFRSESMNICKLLSGEFVIMDDCQTEYQNVSDESLITKKQKILDALIQESLTEKAILNKVGDNRYSRTIIRDMLQHGLLKRQGKVKRK